MVDAAGRGAGMAVLKYKDPTSQDWVAIGVPGITNHSRLTNLTVGNPHTQYLMLSGGSMTGALILTEATDVNHAVSKGYVDARVGAYIQDDSPGNPTATPIPTAPRTALWIDTDEGVAGSDFLTTDGGVITGNLAVNGLLIGKSSPSHTAGYRKITISTAAPVAGQGSDGDIWFQRAT